MIRDDVEGVFSHAELGGLGDFLPEISSQHGKNQSHNTGKWYSLENKTFTYENNSLKYFEMKELKANGYYKFFKKITQLLHAEDIHEKPYLKVIKISRHSRY